MRLSTFLKQIFSKCRFLGSGAGRIILSESELFALMYICSQDLGWEPNELELPGLSEIIPSENYYQIPLQWFDSHTEIAPTSQRLIETLAIGESNFAYEFKLRVTTAASGQGRFSEELSFPQECDAAGLTPILLVLDPTTSSKLDDLEKAFIDAGGRAFIGDEVWHHMEEKAGNVMSIFLEKYIRPPLVEMAIKETLPLETLHLHWSDNEIVIESGTEKYTIPRR